MNIVIIHEDEQGKSIAGTLLSAITGIRPDATVRCFDTHKEPLDGCLGCFKCWVQTPGICIQKKTNSSDYLRQSYAADFVVLISKITFGGYSPQIKAYVDRILPLSHPYFRKLNGETHHVPRYKKYPGILSIGYGAAIPQSEELFRNVSRANQVNAGMITPTFPGTFIWNNNDSDLEQWAQSLAGTIKGGRK